MCPYTGIIKRFCGCCDGSQICQHGNYKPRCREPECIDQAGCICPCGNLRRFCKECPTGGTAYCPCGVLKSTCKVCDPLGHLIAAVRSRIHSALKQQKNKHSIEYLGCSWEFYKKYMEERFEEGMTWENHGEWHIDHIVPIKYGEDTTIEEIGKRFHYTNTQPLWAGENLSKGNRYFNL